MKRTVNVLAVAMMAAAAWAQNPDVVDNVRSTMKSVQQKQANDMKPALAAATGSSAQPAAPASSQPSTTAKTKPATSSQTAKTAAKTATIKAAASKTPLVATPAPATPPTPAATEKKAEPAKPEEKKWAMTGRRDPFFSPVVAAPTGSGCSTGKKCLEIGQINLRGIVKSGEGFIAVVTNSLDKAYFLKENDPVFNGYVVKITTDSVVFQETVQDKLGKSFTREVVKKIFTPAV